MGDELEHAGRRVTVRGLQSLGRDEHEVAAVARVAVNLRGVDREEIGRGDALLTPGAWLDTAEIDVALRGAGDLPANSSCTSGPRRCRSTSARWARGTAAAGRDPLPLRIGDSGCCATPASIGRRGHRGARRAAATAAPPRRGAGRAEELATGRARPPDCARAEDLRAMGFDVTGQRVGEWVVDPQWWAERRQQMMTAVKRWAAEHDIAAGMPKETLRQRVELPAAELVASLLEGTGLEVRDGLVRHPGTACRRGSTSRCARSRNGWPPIRSAHRRQTNSPSSTSARRSSPPRFASGG